MDVCQVKMIRHVDDTSQGPSPSNVNKVKHWINGPEFLRMNKTGQNQAEMFPNLTAKIQNLSQSSCYQSMMISCHGCSERHLVGIDC